jgi:hypothetical protein
MSVTNELIAFLLEEANVIDLPTKLLGKKLKKICSNIVGDVDLEGYLCVGISKFVHHREIETVVKHFLLSLNKAADTGVIEFGIVTDMLSVYKSVKKPIPYAGRILYFFTYTKLPLNEFQFRMEEIFKIFHGVWKEGDKPKEIQQIKQEEKVLSIF